MVIIKTGQKNLGCPININLCSTMKDQNYSSIKLYWIPRIKSLGVTKSNIVSRILHDHGSSRRRTRVGSAIKFTSHSN